MCVDRDAGVEPLDDLAGRVAGDPWRVLTVVQVFGDPGQGCSRVDVDRRDDPVRFRDGGLLNKVDQPVVVVQYRVAALLQVLDVLLVSYADVILTVPLPGLD